MNPLPIASPKRLLIALAAILLATSVAAAQTPPAAASAAENEWLAKTARLYYSSAKAGLTGFDCSVHPDWRTIFASAGKGESTSDDEANIALLNTVKITLHARMKGGSTIEWVAAADPDKPLDDRSSELLDKMHQGIQHTLDGFLQFWAPFFENTVVPDSADGLEITHTPTAHIVHAKQNGTELTETYSSSLVLEQFNVDLNGSSIKLSPAYKPTAQGLLVNAFAARILPSGAAPAQQQDMKVSVDYQPLDSFTIPSRLHMEIAGAGIFNFTFDACSANPK